jgi:sec-independent protein translocase protein TatC
MQTPAALASVAFRPVTHEARMTVVDHLEELRSRLIVSVVAVLVAFGFCFWQNHQILRIVNAPLAHNTQQQVRAGRGPLGATYRVQVTTRDVAAQVGRVAGVLSAQSRSATARTALTSVQRSLNKDVKALSAAPQGDRPVTLGIGEPFTSTLTVTLIFALILSLPVLLLQAYGFLMPAFSAEQRRHMLPVTCAIPVLFAAGIAFGYFVVLPAALHFFQNFNSGEFNVLVQASQYYKFAATTLLAMGLLFQIPVGIIAVTRAGLITPAQLRHHRRYAVLACVVAAALLPSDVITMLLEVVPLYLLFEVSVLIAAISERRGKRRAARTANAEE